MNWGNKILFTIIVFIVAMLSMVFIAFKQSNEMIDKDYYEKELKYENIIAASKNLHQLNEAIELTQDSMFLNIQLPRQAANNITKGFIEMLKADSQIKDFNKTLVANNSSLIQVEKQRLVRGLYTIRVSWVNNNTPYYHEQKINIIK